MKQPFFMEDDESQDINEFDPDTFADEDEVESEDDEDE